MSPELATELYIDRRWILFYGVALRNGSFIRHQMLSLETFMGVEQRAGPDTNPRISRVVSKSDGGHVTATTATEPLG